MLVCSITHYINSLIMLKRQHNQKRKSNNIVVLDHWNNSLQRLRILVQNHETHHLVAMGGHNSAGVAAAQRILRVIANDQVTLVHKEHRRILEAQQRVLHVVVLQSLVGLNQISKANAGLAAVLDYVLHNVLLPTLTELLGFQIVICNF